MQTLRSLQVKYRFKRLQKPPLRPQQNKCTAQQRAQYKNQRYRARRAPSVGAASPFLAIGNDVEAPTRIQPFFFCILQPHDLISVLVHISVAKSRQSFDGLPDCSSVPRKDVIEKISDERRNYQSHRAKDIVWKTHVSQLSEDGRGCFVGAMLVD